MTCTLRLKRHFVYSLGPLTLFKLTLLIYVTPSFYFVFSYVFYFVKKTIVNERIVLEFSYNLSKLIFRSVVITR